MTFQCIRSVTNIQLNAKTELISAGVLAVYGINSFIQDKYNVLNGNKKVSKHVIEKNVINEM